MNEVQTNREVRGDQLPLIIHVGFAGARTLYDADQHPGVDPQSFAEIVEAELTALLRELPQKLEIPAGPFRFCGISSLAIGGDTMFIRACRAAGWMHRVFLPQHTDEFLEATGSAGPDFSAPEKDVARELLAQPHVIQERVVSDAPTRHERFRDVNVEIARISDVMISLLRFDQQAGIGGSFEIIELARKRGRPVAEMRISVSSSGKPHVNITWHGPKNNAIPCLPEELAHVRAPELAASIPEIRQYTEYLKELGSRHANRLSFWFGRAALIIVIGHVLATILAVTSLEAGRPNAPWQFLVPWLTLAEVVLLVTGFLVHQALHHTHTVKRWASLRLISEVARSMRAAGQYHVYLHYLFRLPFPPNMRPLLRTLSTLHLASTRSLRFEPWEPRRDEYIQRRLVDKKLGGQIPYYERTRDRAGRWITWSRGGFLTASGLAIALATLKLLSLFHWVEIPPLFKTLLGCLIIILPVIAVACVSLSVAFDQEARYQTSSEMLAFLEEQKSLLERSRTASEFQHLLLETETRLMGEVTTWFARRTFTGVT